MGNVTHPIQVKDMYVQGLNDPFLRKLLSMWQDAPLQKLMGKAYSFGYQSAGGSYKPSNTAGQTTTTSKPAPSTRKQCHKCAQWFDVAKGVTCACPERQPRAPRKPKVNEAEWAVQEGAVEEHDGGSATEDDVSVAASEQSF